MSENIDILDKRILYELDRNSSIRWKQLGKKIRASKETVAYRVKKLRENGYIKNFLTTVNISNLNRFYYKLYYKFHKTTPDIEKQIADFIRNYRGIAYFASLEGRYNITFLLLSESMQDLRNFLTPFIERFGTHILEQEILTMYNVHRFNFRFFYDKGELQHTKYPEELKNPKLDELDYLITRTLAQNSRVTLVELAKLTKKEINTIKYRIKKLRKLGILETPVLEIDFSKFDMQHTQVSFSLKDYTLLNQMIKYVAELPQSTFATTTFGKYDLSVEFVTKNTKELRTLLNGIKEKFSDSITDYDVFIMEEHRVNWFPI